MSKVKKEIVIKKESDYVIHSKEKALKKSIFEGSLLSAGASFSNNFITPFALALGANGFHIGLLSSISGLSSPLGELRGSKLMEKYSRKKIILLSRFLVIFLFIPLIGLIYLFINGLFLKYLPYAMILIWAILIQFMHGVSYVSWLSWIGDLIPPDKRGRYFSKRNRINGFIGLICFLIAGFVLDIFKTKGYVLLGFTFLFGVSMIFRISSRQVVKRIFNPEFRVRKGHYFSFKDFVKRYDNFGKFAFYQAFSNLAAMISYPFFAFYMLDDLKFSYLIFTFVSMSPIVFYLLFSPLAGKFSDKYGNVKLFYFSAFLFPLVPLMWIFVENPIWLILLPGLISGIATSAFIIGTTDFSFDAVSQQKRGLCFAYTAILIGLGILIGSFIGGLIVQYVDMPFIKPIFFAFAVSSLLMIMVSLFFLPQIKDERKTDRLKGLNVDLIHPFKMINSDLAWFKNFIHQK